MSKRASKSELAELTVPVLRARSRELDIPGRSGMNKPQLIRAILKHERLAAEGPPDDGTAGEIQVWQAFVETPSIAAVARKVGLSRRKVRNIILGDRHRLETWRRNLQAEAQQAWLEREIAAHEMIDELVLLYRAMLDEIKAAAAEGRITNIRDRDGYPMPVLDAMQFLVMARLMDQVTNLASKAHAENVAYATGKTPSVEAGDADKELRRMTDYELVMVARESGINLPPAMEKIAQRIEAEQRGEDAEGPVE